MLESGAKKTRLTNLHRSEMEDMSVKCPGCGCESQAAVKFCPECGARMPGATAISAASHEEALSLGDLRTMQGAGSGKPVGEALSLGAMATMEKPAAGRDDSALKGLPLAVRYELLEEIGHGGFAQVWKARDRKLGRTVAVKRLKTAVLGGAEGKRTLERFAREAAAIAGRFGCGLGGWLVGHAVVLMWISD